MLKLFCSSYVRCGVLGLLGTVAISTAHAQLAQASFLDRQLDRTDVAVSAMTDITKGVSGTNGLGDSVTQNASTTVGALVQLRYTKSPLLGVEFNYSYSRYTENYSGEPFGTTTTTGVPFGVQTNASEYSLGYVAHLPTFLGVQPFAAVGAGATAFKPTPGGGQGLTERARATYYYTVGVDDQLTRFFGVRAQFRQGFFKAPDFGQNYLNVNQQTINTEPSIGFFVKF